MSFWKRTEPTLAEQAVTAVDRISADIVKLHQERQDALGCLHCMAKRLGEINAQLGEKSALCGILIAQLSREQESIAQRVSDNEKVRAKILDIIGE